MSLLMAAAALWLVVAGPAHTLATEPVPPPKTAPGPLAARVAGSRTSWEKAHGEPTSEDQAGGSAAYAVEGYADGFTASFLGDQVIRLDFQAARADTPLLGAVTAPDDADWTVAEALKVAAGFAPRDARVTGDPFTTVDGNLVFPVVSKAAAAALSPEAYTATGAGGVPGSLQHLIFTNTAGGVYAIEVGPGEATEVSVGSTAAGGASVETPSSEQDAAPATGFSGEEVAYVGAIGGIAEGLNQTLLAISTLFGEPSTAWDDAWEARLSRQLPPPRRLRGGSRARPARVHGRRPRPLPGGPQGLRRGRRPDPTRRQQPGHLHPQRRD